jgi:mitotic spindle assembly checkpoint protein MAD2B
MPPADKQVLDCYDTLVKTFIEFLTVATHTILYERGIYPRESFASTRKYNYPVRQNRHPAVCRWIDDAVAAVRTELLKVSSGMFTSKIPIEWFECVPASRIL